MVQPRPSEVWNGREELGSASGPFPDRIRHVLNAANFQHLEHQALAARKRLETHLDGAVSCSIDRSVFAFGRNNVVLEIAFSDNVYWVAKVQHAAVAKSDIIYMLSEIATMKLVQERTTIPVPRVFEYQTESSNDFEFPYILMEFLPGRDVGSRFVVTVPAEFLPKVARQLADVLFQLEKELSFEEMGIIWCGTDCAGPAKIISLPSKKNSYDLDHLSATPCTSPQTSLEWFQKYRKEENNKIMKQHRKDPEWNTACWVLKDAISHFIVDDRIHGPFPLCHVDFHHGNLLFDDEYNLTGVIDWRHAQTVPLERLALSQEFIAGPLFPDELKKTVATFVTLVRASLQELGRGSARTRSNTDVDMQGEPVSDVACGGESETGSGTRGRHTDVGVSDVSRVQRTRLADIFATTQYQIAYRCTIGNPRVALPFGKMVQELIFGEHVSWEQMVLALGKKRLE